MLILEVVHFKHIINVHYLHLHLTFHFNIICIAIDMNPNAPPTVRMQAMMYFVRGESIRDQKTSVPSAVTQLQIKLRIRRGRLHQEQMNHSLKLLRQLSPPSQEPSGMDLHLLYSISDAMYMSIEISVEANGTPHDSLTIRSYEVLLFFKPSFLY